MRLAVVVAVLALAAVAAARPACELDGVFRLRGKPVIVRSVDGTERQVDSVRIEGPAVAIGLIAPRDVGAWRERRRMYGPRRGLIRFPERSVATRLDGDAGHDVSITARLRPCTRLVGRIGDTVSGRRRPFRAVQARCGDGVVDTVAEDCEVDADCPAGVCTDTCVCRAAGGRLDDGFGDGGTVVHQIGTEPSGSLCDARPIGCRRAGPFGVQQLAIRPDGRILALGIAPTWASGGYPAHLAQYHPDGSLDVGFGDDGLAVVMADRMRLQPDGRVLLAGGLPRDPGERLASPGHWVSRVLADGTTDADVHPATSLVGPAVADVAPLADGAFVTTMYEGARMWKANGDWAGAVPLPAGTRPLHVDDLGRLLVGDVEPPLRLRRIFADGSVDPTFGAGDPVCVVAPDADVDEDFGRVSVMPTGDVFVEIEAHRNGTSWRRVLRLPADGGDVGADCARGGPPVFPGALPSALQADGKLLSLAGGELRRYLPDGSADPTFGSLGRIAVTNQHAIAVAPDGAIVTAGGVFVGQSEAFTLTRRTP
jgi:uncharacterized delta-60 repeat protein